MFFYTTQIKNLCKNEYIKSLSFFGNASGNSNKANNRLKYKELTLGIKQTVLERAKNRCQNCSKKLSGSNQPYYHHINGSAKDNRPENIKALCKECYTDQMPKERGFSLSSMKNIFSKKD